MISTTIKQSQHLLELGLDPKTADMCYEPYMSEDGGIDITDLGLCLTPYMLNSRISFPAWSLSALLEVMPITITKDGMEYKLKVFPSGLFSTHSDTSKWTVQYCGRDYSYRARDKYPILVKVTQHDLTDAAYEMAVWLLEQGLIKKGK
jgi:hypothetical protein